MAVRAMGELLGAGLGMDVAFVMLLHYLLSSVTCRTRSNNFKRRAPAL
jgi:hypothetical protein